VARPPAVARVLERVTATARAHELFLPGDVVLVAVSGGPDSVCLLESLLRLRRLLRIRVEVFHFDHRLRPGSEKDAAYVRRLAERHRVPVHLRAAEDAPARGESVEAWARGRRLRAAHEVQREIGARRIAVAHTMDDQAETVLLAALTGGGLEAVSGMRPAVGPFVRPLLDVTREEVEAFCRACHLRPRVDPSNVDRRFLRNALRLDGLPALERAVGRPVREPLARTAALLREDADELARGAEGRRRPRRARRVAAHGDRRDARGRRGRARPRRGPARTAPRPDRGFEGGTHRAVCFALSPFPREPGVKGGGMEGRGQLSELENLGVDPSISALERNIERVIITEDEIQAMLRRLGDQITEDYEGRDLLLVGVLKGAFVMMADLSRYIRLPVETDFMAVASYGASTKTSGVVRILKDLDHDLEGRDVLLVEDIVDSGLTLNYLLKNLRGRRPASLEVCALLKKTGIQRVEIDVRYCGFEIPPDFVVGYGLDFAEKYRNLPYIGLLKPEAYGEG
jgi:hypoxanthine phosphoribosyltransferase